MPLMGTIGHYEIIEPLGSGAMGEVYKASDSKLFARVVALKILSERLSKNDQARTRFQREVEVAAKLEHPNIVTIHDQGEHDGRPYFVMEFLDGTDLATVIRRGENKNVEKCVDLARQIGEALGFAHSKNVIHRDVKPANIMIVQRGGVEQAKLVDFGIVHVESSSLTRTQTQPGTFSYMSPEQLRNDPINHRSDLFSLGIVLYELFTGVHPFEAASEALITNMILREEPESARRKNPNIPASLDSLVLKLLEKDSTQRPETAGEVAEALRLQLRKLQSRWASTDPAEYENLDEMTRETVERYVTWARQKEAEGAIEEALQAYEQANKLAPDSDRIKRKIPKLRHRIESERMLRDHLQRAAAALDAGNPAGAREHWRSAWVLSPDSEEVAALEQRIEAAEVVAPEDRERVEFVESRIRRAEEELDAGRLDNARPPLVEILRRYPDETLAGFMLDRLIAITTSGVPYAEYRERLKEARRALAEGRFDQSRLACARARDLWPGDEEAASLERDITTRLEGEVSSLLARAERLVQQAEEGDQEAVAALESVGQAIVALERARALGGEEKWIQGALDEARRLEAGIKTRAAEATRLESQRAERREKLVESLLTRGRGLLKEATTHLQGGVGEAALAYKAYEESREAFEQVLLEDSTQEEAQESRRRIESAMKGLAARIEEEKARAREVSERIEVARRLLQETEEASRGDVGELDRCLKLLAECRSALDRVRTLERGNEMAEALQQEAVTLETFVRKENARRQEKRTEIEARRKSAIEEGLTEGRRLREEAQALAAGDLEDVFRAEDACRASEKAYRRVLAVQADHPEALEACTVLASLVEHAHSEVSRRKEEVRKQGEVEAEKKQREEKEARARSIEAQKLEAEGRMGAALADADRILRDALPLKAHLEEEADVMVESLAGARERLEEVLRLDQGHAVAQARLAEVDALETLARPRVDQARQRRAVAGFRGRIEQVQALRASGKAKEAQALLGRLDREGRAQEFLHPFIPEITRLRGQIHVGFKPKWLILGGGIAGGLVVVAGLLWILLPSKPPASFPEQESPTSSANRNVAKKLDAGTSGTEPAERTHDEAAKKAEAKAVVGNQGETKRVEVGKSSVPGTPTEKPPATLRDSRAGKTEAGSAKGKQVVPAPRTAVEKAETEPSKAGQAETQRPERTGKEDHGAVSAPKASEAVAAEPKKQPVLEEPKGGSMASQPQRPNPVPAMQASFYGTITENNRPVGGFEVVMKEVVSGKLFKSPASSATGQYSMAVPVGGRYKLEAAMAPDGRRRGVQNVPPLRMERSGSNRLDVHVTGSP